VLSIFGMARSSHVFKGLSIACCAAVVPLVGLTLFVGGPSIYGSRPSIYDGDPSTFVAGYERHDHWVTVNGERYDYELYDVDGKVKDAIQSARYEKLPESPKLDQEKRWCDFYVPYDDAAYVEVSEEGYAWIYILPDGPFSSSTYGYYSLEPSVASDIVNLADEVVADGKSVHEEARQKAEAEGDLSHFLKAVSKLNTPWVENLADGCSRYVKDNGSVLSAIKGAAHTLNPSLSAGKYSEELLIYNNDSWYASNLPGWSYVLFTKKTIAKVQRRFTDANGSDGWVSMSYGLPYSDGEVIWNALVALYA